MSNKNTDNHGFLSVQQNNKGEFLFYTIDKEAKAYDGCEYTFNNMKCIQRTAKITPKKTGQFVTLWKRNKHAITTPFTSDDVFDYVIIICMHNQNSGHFLFSKQTLIDKGIVSSAKNGKRGFRVYPSWSHPKSKQAALTQQWQLEHFRKNLHLNIKHRPN